MLAIPVAQHGHAALVHLLDAFGADLEEVDDVRGGPPLMHAANNGHSAAVNALVAVRCGKWIQGYNACLCASCEEEQVRAGGWKRACGYTVLLL